MHDGLNGSGDGWAALVDADLGGTRTPTDLVCERLRCVAEYRGADLEDLRPRGMKDRDWRLVIHEATDRLLDEGVVFSPLNGVYRRATKLSQVTGREANFSSAALKKMGRALKMVAAAAPLAESDDDRRLIERRELKRQNAIVSAKSALRGAGMSRPKGV